MEDWPFIRIFATDMRKPTNHLSHTLSFKIALRVVAAIALLLMTAVIVVLWYTHKAMKEDSMHNASETLEYTILHIDNQLLSVEQSAGNVYWDLLMHLDQPERMFTYARKLVEANPYITGCAIAMKPGYYAGPDSCFMAYFYRKVEGGDTIIVQADTFADGPYYSQEWYTVTMETGQACWIDPLKDADKDNEAITTFSLPIYDRKGQVVGVMGTDLSTILLSNIIEAAKPTPNAYAVLMGGGGSFVVFPDSKLLYHQGQITRLLQQSDASVREAVQAMARGESGYHRVRTEEGYSYVFYRPFTRAAVPGRVEQQLGWSAAVVLPEHDIKGSFLRLRALVIAVAVAGLLLLFVLCRTITHRQLLPLRMLAESAQRIAQGHYHETIDDTTQSDEVGQLQRYFRNMQLSLSNHIGELQRLSDNLRQHGDELEAAYTQAKEGERLKTAVLHNMTNQMLPPVTSIDESVEKLCNDTCDLGIGEVERLTHTIEQQGTAVTQLLSNLLDSSQKEEPTRNNQDTTTR